MPDGRAAAYGSWKSPITSELIVSRTVGFDQTAVDGEDIYWTEMRPAEGGRYVVVRRTRDGRAEDVTPAPFMVTGSSGPRSVPHHTANRVIITFSIARHALNMVRTSGPS